MNENMSPHSPSMSYQKKIARDKWANDRISNQKTSVADQILRQVNPGFNPKQFKNYPGPKVSSDDIMKRIHELQEAGYVTNARVQRPSTSPETTMVVEFTPAGIDSIVMRKSEPELMDTEFLADQIVEYQDQIPKAFLEGLKAAEGILRGTDFLENYIEVK